MTSGELYWVGAACILAGWWLLARFVNQTEQRRVVSREPAVVVRRSRAQVKIVELDTPKSEAVEALVRDGWKRKAAVSALASNGWRGYPDVPKMVLNAWQSMPGYRW